MTILESCFSRKSRKKEVYIYSLEDYNETYEVTLKILKFLGIRLTRNDSPLVARFWTTFYWFEFCNMILAMGLEIASMLQTAKGGSFDDAVQIFLMMPCMGYILLAVTKSGKLMCNRSVFENLVRELREMWPREALMEEDHLIVKKGLVHLNRVIKGYYWCNNILLLIFMTPSFLIAAKRELGYDVTLILPFFYWFPFDPYQRHLYPFLLVTQTWQGVVVVLCMITGDLLFVIFLNHISTQFDLLSARVRRSIFVPVDRQMISEYPLGIYGGHFEKKEMGVSQKLGDKLREKQLQTELTQIIFRHRTLIRLAGDVENMFSFSLLVNFFNSSIIICFCGFCCVLVEKWNEFVYKVFLLAALSQTWLLCWHGQRLLDSSAGVADALYESGWYKSGTKISKSICIMLHRSQKSVRVTTYGFSAISMETFATILKTSWSYFTLLLKIYGK